MRTATRCSGSRCAGSATTTPPTSSGSGGPPNCGGGSPSRSSGCLADRLGVKEKQLPDYATLQYAKVAEYQLRGLIHFHALIRLDGPKTDTGFAAAPDWLTADLVSDLVAEAAAAVRFTAPPVFDGDAPRGPRVRCPGRHPPGPHGEPHRRPGAGPDRRAGRRLPRQVLDEVRHRHGRRQRAEPAPAPGRGGRHRVRRTGRGRLGARRDRRPAERLALRAAAEVGAIARVPGTLRDQVAPLLGHPRRAAPCPPPRPGAHRRRAAGRPHHRPGCARGRPPRRRRRRDDARRRPVALRRGRLGQRRRRRARPRRCRPST